MPYFRAESSKTIKVTKPPIPLEILWIIAPALLGIIMTAASRMR